jgi:hypothetical protein
LMSKRFKKSYTFDVVDFYQWMIKFTLRWSKSVENWRNYLGYVPDTKFVLHDV